MLTGQLRIFHKIHEGVNCRPRYGHHQPGEEGENHSLPLGQLRTKKGAKQILIEGNRAVYKLLPFGRIVLAETVKTKIEEVQTGRMFNVIGIDENEAVSQAMRMRGREFR